MAFTITKFRESIGKQKGISRPNLFQVEITGAGAGGIPTDGFSFQCKIATIPPSTLGVIEIQYFGRIVKIPGNRTFDNLSLTVLNDAAFSIRNPIEKWMSKYNSHEANLSNVTDPNTLMAGLEVTHYNINSDPTGVWKFVNCFPVALGEIGLDWGSNDTAEEFTVDFAYDYWTHAGGAEGSSGGSVG